MPEHRVLWLPDFLRDSRPARVGLGVLVWPGAAAQLDNPKDPHRAMVYLEAWKEKVQEVVARVEKAEGQEEVCRQLDTLGPRVVSQYWPGGKNQEELAQEILEHPEGGGPNYLWAYLNDPNPEHKKNLLDCYSQSPEYQHLDPKAELQEQEEFSLDEFLQSL